MRSFLVTLTILALAGCTSQRPDCGFLTSGYGRLASNLAALPDIPLTTFPEGARVQVERCYPAHPYLNYHGSFRFVGVKRAANGNPYLVYEPSGISDVELVFELASDFRPIRAFQYSTL
jgi:hypothetical protein